MPITADNEEISGGAITLALPENAGPGTKITSFGHTDSGATLRLSITGGNPNNRFSINGNNELVHNRAGLDFEDDDLDDFSLTISYVLEYPDNRPLTPVARYEAIVQVTDVDEKPTEIIVATVRNALAAGTYANGKKLAEISFDDDALGTNTPVLKGGLEEFEIRGDAVTGWELWLRNGTVLEQTAEGTGLIDTLIAWSGDSTDTAEDPAPVEFALQITQANRPPETTDSTNQPTDAYSFTVDEGLADTRVGTINATDPEGGTLVYFLSASAGDLFAINSQGQLSLLPGAKLDYEAFTEHRFSVWIYDTDVDNPQRTIVPVTVAANNVIENRAVEPDAKEIIQLADVEDARNSMTKLAIGKVKFGSGGAVDVLENGDRSTKFAVENGILVVKTGATLGVGSYNITLTTGTGDDKESQEVTIKVNDIKTGAPLPDNIHEGGTLTLSNTRLGKDDQGDTLYFVEQSGTTTTPSGSYTVSENGEQLVYTPNSDFTGKDTFSVGIRDDSGGTTTQEVVITVQPPLDITGRFTALEDSPWADANGTFTIAESIRSGTYALRVGNTEIATDSSTGVALHYGTLTVDKNDGWSYVVDNGNADVEALHGRENRSGHSLTETVTLDMTYGGETLTKTFDITITGATDYYTPAGGFGLTANSHSTTHLSLHADNAGYNLLSGALGNDILTGGGGVDQLYGYAGNDMLIGGRGNDHLVGGHGRDVLDGGRGYDTLYGGWAGDVFILDPHGGAGDRDIVGDFSSDDKIRVDTADGNEATIAKLQMTAEIRWTNNSNASIGNRPTNDANIDDTVIYATKGTAAKSDDVVLMILEDFNTELTMANFEVA